LFISNGIFKFNNILFMREGINGIEEEYEVGMDSYGIGSEIGHSLQNKFAKDLIGTFDAGTGIIIDPAND
jgi:hypothetical protein